MNRPVASLGVYDTTELKDKVRGVIKIHGDETDIDPVTCLYTFMM